MTEDTYVVTYRRRCGGIQSPYYVNEHLAMVVKAKNEEQLRKILNENITFAIVDFKCIEPANVVILDDVGDGEVME